MTMLKKGFTEPWDVVSVIPDYPFIIVQFADWKVKHIDMSPLMSGPNPGVFDNLNDISFFNRVRVVEEQVTWPGEIDIDSETIYSYDTLC